LALFAVLGIGLWLRVHGLEAESAWYDEVCSVGEVGAPSLRACFERQTRNREMMPFYFMLQYYWAHHVSPSTAGIRLLSVIFGVLTLPVLYLLGRGMYGPRAGLLATAFLALSPFHTVHSQSLRPYPLLCLLAVVSAYTFVEMNRGRKWGWLCANLVANCLMVWVHLFGVWLALTQGLLLLLFHRKEIKRLAVWCGIQGLNLAPVALLVSSWDAPGTPPLPFLPWEPLVGLFFTEWFRVIPVLFWYDADYHVTQLPALLVWMRPLVYVAAVLLGLLFIASFVGVVRRIVGEVGRKSRTFIKQPGDAYRCADGRLSRCAAEEEQFLIMWFLVPTLMLLLVTLIYLPAYQVRYVLYGVPALYLLTAGYVEDLESRRRKVMITSLVVLFALASGVGAAIPMRADYHGVAGLVKARWQPGESILVFPDMSRDAVAYTFADASFPVEESPRIPELMGVVDARAGSSEGTWLILDLWNTRQGRHYAQLFEKYPSLRGLQYERSVFAGRWDIAVYHFGVQEGYLSATTSEAIRHFRDGLSDSLEDLVLRWRLAQTLVSGGRFEEALREYRHIQELLPYEHSSRARMNEILEDVGWSDDYTLEFFDDYVLDVTEGLCEVLVALARIEEALQACSKGLEVLPGNPRLTARLEALQKDAAALKGLR